MATLLLISTPGGKLTYEDGDIIEILPADKEPGTAVMENLHGGWSFVYITDKDHDDSELLDLVAPLTEGTGEAETQTKKRGCSCALPGWPSGAYSTFYSLADATAQQKMTWSVFQAKVAGKGGA